MGMSLKALAKFMRSLRTSDSCVYVASGPQAHRCVEFSGDLIGINNTWRVMGERKPLLMITQFAQYLVAMDRDCVSRVICPHEVCGLDKALISPHDCGFPRRRIRTFEMHVERGLTPDRIEVLLEAGKLRGVPRIRGVGTYGLLICAMAGYRRIMCCGHDGGIGRHAALHDDTAPATRHHMVNLETTRAMAAMLVRNKYCKKITFAQD